MAGQEVIHQTSGMIATMGAELAADYRLASAHTKRCYLSDLRAFEAWRAGRTITKRLAGAYLQELQESGLSVRTLNRKAAALRWWARRLADLAMEDTTLDGEARQYIAQQAAAVADLKGVRGEAPERGRLISDGELAAMLAVCAADTSPAGARDAAMFALARSTGLRRAELAGLAMEDVTATEDGYDLRLVGKGNKARTAHAYNGTSRYLREWLDVRGTEDGPLFRRIRKTGAMEAGRLSTDGLAFILAKRAREANLATDDLTWHDFRRTFVSQLLETDDLATVQKLVGHASPATTAAYDRRPEERRRQAVRRVHVPYFGRK